MMCYSEGAPGPPAQTLFEKIQNQNLLTKEVPLGSSSFLVVDIWAEEHGESKTCLEP